MGPRPPARPRSAGPAVDGVLFDIDDTLVDTRGAFRQALAGVAEVYLPHVPPTRLEEVLTVWRADAGGHYRRYTGGAVRYEDQRMARANELQEAFGGAALNADAYAGWAELFEAGLERAWAPHADAPAVVGALRAAGIPVGALSNAAVSYQTTKLERAGFAGSVPMLVGLDTLGVGKPDPAVFLEACRLLGTDPARTAYIGDELDIDAQAAARAGLVGIWLDRPGSRRARISADDVAAAGVLVLPGLTGLAGALGLSL